MLEGNVRSLAHDTLYIYGADALYEHIDTVVAVDGAFNYTATVDTVTPLWILFPNKHRELVFADKGLESTIYGDTASAGCLHIVGSQQDALLQEFYRLEARLSDKSRITALADSFIRANPYSEVSIHLLREYFVHQPTLDVTKIKTLIGSMSGNLQDNNYIKQLQSMLNAYKPLRKGNMVNSYSVIDSEGKHVTTSEYKDAYLLITFWASWDAESRQRQRELIPIWDKYESPNFNILSVSLDTDRTAWLQAIAEDSVTWRQACDYDGWETGIVQRLQITHLPTNVLLDPSRRIQAMDLHGEALEKKVVELTEKSSSDASKQVKKSPSTIRSIKK